MAKARVAVLISGAGTNMAALLYAAKHFDCPYEIVLVASNNPDAVGLTLAKAEGIATFAQSHVGFSRAEHDEIMHNHITKAGATYVVLAGYMRMSSSCSISSPLSGSIEQMFSISSPQNSNLIA